MGRPRRLAGSAGAGATNAGEGAAGAQRVAPPALSSNGARAPNAPPRSKAVGRRAIGKPTSCYSLDVAKGCWFSTNEKPASASFIIRSIEKLSSPPELSLDRMMNDAEAGFSFVENQQ